MLGNFAHRPTMCHLIKSCFFQSANDLCTRPFRLSPYLIESDVLAGHALLPLIFAVSLLLHDRDTLLGMSADRILQRLSSSPSLFTPLQVPPHPLQVCTHNSRVGRLLHVSSTTSCLRLACLLVSLHILTKLNRVCVIELNAHPKGLLTSRTLCPIDATLI